MTLGDVVNREFQEIVRDLTPLEGDLDLPDLESVVGKTIEPGLTSRTLPFHLYGPLRDQLQERVSATAKSSRMTHLVEHIRVEHDERFRQIVENGASVNRWTNMGATAIAGVYIVLNFLGYGLLGLIPSFFQAVAIGGFTYDTVRQKGRKFGSMVKHLAILAHSEPIVRYYLDFSETGDPYMARGMVLSAVSPALTWVLGAAFPAYDVAMSKWRERKIPQRQEDLRNALGEMGTPLKQRMRRLNNVLNEIQEVQSLPGDHSAFDEQCIDYLQGDANIQAVYKERDFLTPKASALENTPIIPPLASIRKVEPVRRKATVPVKTHDPGTYNLLTSIGLNETNSTRIARKKNLEAAAYIVDEIKAALGEGYKTVLQRRPDIFLLRERVREEYKATLYELVEEFAGSTMKILGEDPSLLLLQGKERETYLATVRDYKGRFAKGFSENVPNIYKPEHNPIAFASADGLAVLDTLRQQDIDSDNIDDHMAPGLGAEGYNNVTVLSAMVQAGFGIGTNEPYQNGRSSSRKNIRKRTREVTTPHRFDLTLAKLCNDGAVLEQKGEYSFTPDLMSIKSPALRQYVAFVAMS